MTRRVTFTDNVEVHHDVYVKCTENETLRTLKYFEPLIDWPFEKQMRRANGCSKVYLKYSQKENYGVAKPWQFCHARVVQYTTFFVFSDKLLSAQ